MKNDEVRRHVRARYAQIAESFTDQMVANCGCGTASVECCSTTGSQSIQLYEDAAVIDLPQEVTGLSLGCGDPVTLASLLPGQTVLDLGSGGGIDCFLAAQKVGPSGRVIGVDMTPAMLDKARSNQKRLGFDNVEFRLGEIEHLPVADSSVDVIISNCVINLSLNKAQVFRDAYRVLRPGGKLAVSDMVTAGPLPDTIKDSLSAWAGCIAGAQDVEVYIQAIRAAGFINVEVTPVYLAPEMIDQAVSELGEEIDISQVSGDDLQRTLFSAKIIAWKAAREEH